MVSSETVTFDVNENGDCIPYICIEKDGGGDRNVNRRTFRKELDMERVLDFKDVDAMEDGTMLLCCTIESTGEISFPKKRMCLRGGYLFYFNINDTDNNNNNNNNNPDDTTTTNNINNNNNNNNNMMGDNTNHNPFDDDNDADDGMDNIMMNGKNDGGGVGWGVIPLENVVVDFPPGGRRVFREHAMTDARSGYEFCLRHDFQEGNPESSDDDEDEYDDEEENNDGHQQQKEHPQQQRKRQYLVAESLGQRESWAKAIRARVSKDEPTGLRVNAQRSSTIDSLDNTNHKNMKSNVPASLRKIPDLPLHNPANLFHHQQYQQPGNPSYGGGSAGNSSKHEGQDHQKDVDEALDQFGQSRFDENLWLDDYFERHEDFDAPAICRTLEKWQAAVKQGLRGAVLEQYEYFVEASREMTTMGREVAHLRNLVENQLQTIQTMKEIDFAAAFDYHPIIVRPGDDDDHDFLVNADDDQDNYSTDDDDDILMDDDMDDPVDDDHSSRSSNPYDQPFDIRRNNNNNNSNNNNHHPKSNKMCRIRSRDAEDHSTPVTLLVIPDWLDDVPEEISAFIKECRYTDATELLLKAKAEIADTLTMHEKLTDKALSKKQLATLSRMSQHLQSLSDRMGNRLAESLRRKNEAMRHAAKRERSDPLSHLAPIISPICLNDDAPALQLLVRLGRHNNAATAYAARRSLLLMESLQERPIASLTTGSNNNADVVIYAAQVSMSFFSCLAMSVEGFLDLFLGTSTSTGDYDSRDELMEEMSSIHSSSEGRNVPAGALSAIVLWCDSELAKFATVFGGSRLLGGLALSPKVMFSKNNHRKNINNALSTAISKFENIAGIAQQKNQLRAAEENGEFQVAAILRRKIAQYQKDQKDGVMPDESLCENNNIKKERQDAIIIAAKCIDKAFQFASENLDTIGLPLLSRLSECMRSRLKGCESEIADALGPKWYHVTYDWKEAPGEDTIMPERRRSNTNLEAISSNENLSKS